MTFEITHFLSVAWEAATVAGTLICEHWQKPKNIDYKGAIDLVTSVDRECERRIVKVLRNHFPNHSILAEEETDWVGTQSNHRWIIDPLDGTTNFAHGYPQFCVSIALECDGEVILGLVYDPLRGECFKAVKGEGATLNGGSIRISGVKELDKALLATGFPYDQREKSRFLSELFQGVHDPLSGHPAQRLCSSGSLLRGLRSNRWILGTKASPLGHGGGRSDR